MEIEIKKTNEKITENKIDCLNFETKLTFEDAVKTIFAYF